MKRRLRKKKHRGDFAEWGRQLVIMRNRKDGFDEFFFGRSSDAINGAGSRLGIYEKMGCCSWNRIILERGKG